MKCLKFLFLQNLRQPNFFTSVPNAYQNLVKSIIHQKTCLVCVIEAPHPPYNLFIMPNRKYDILIYTQNLRLQRLLHSVWNFFRDCPIYVGTDISSSNLNTSKLNSFNFFFFKISQNTTKIKMIILFYTSSLPPHLHRCNNLSSIFK